MAQYIDETNVPVSEPILSLSLPNENRSANCKEKEEKEDEDSTHLDKEKRRSKKLNTFENVKTSQDCVTDTNERSIEISQIERNIATNDSNIKNAETQTRIHPLSHMRKSPAKERLRSPLRKRMGNSPSRSPACRVSNRRTDESKSDEWSNITPAETIREENSEMLQPNDNCCKSERPLSRHIFGPRCPLLPSETVRRTPSETFAACQAAFLHSTPDDTEIDEPILLPLQAEASFDGDWITDPVSSLVSAGPGACCLAETIDDRLASSSMLSLAGGSLCRLLPLGNASPRLRRNESSSSSSSELDSIGSNSSVCRRRTDFSPLELPPLTQK